MFIQSTGTLMLRVTELGFCYCVGNTYMHSLDGLKCNSNYYLVSRMLCMNLKMTTKWVYSQLLIVLLWRRHGLCLLILLEGSVTAFPTEIILKRHFYGLISSRMTKPPPEKQGKVIECFDEYENNMDYIYYLLDFGLMCFISAAELKSNRWGAIKPVGSGAVKPYYWLRMTISLQQEKKKMVLRCNLFTLAKNCKYLWWSAGFPEFEHATPSTSGW